MINIDNPTVKICGLSSHASIQTAIDSGAAYLGFIFFPKSPRNVTPEQAADLAEQTGFTPTVAVTVNAEESFLDEIVEVMHPTHLQLHGSESPDRVVAVRQLYGLPVIKALSVSVKEDLAKITPYHGATDMLLLDAKPPKGADLPGGNGVTFDWTVLDGLQSDTPILLSGGLDLDNAGLAMSLVRDSSNAIIGLDVSSGVESAPGVKDDAKIAAFLKACRD